jgi:sugar phosphate permease
MFKGSYLVTYPVAGFMIKNFKWSTFYWVMTAVSVAAAFFLLLLTDPEKESFMG